MHAFVLMYEDKSSAILSLLLTEVSAPPSSAVIQSQRNTRRPRLVINWLAY